jgi:hypothetical protein
LLDTPVLFYDSLLSIQLQILHELQTAMCVFEAQFVPLLLHFVFAAQFSIQLLQFLIKFIFLFGKLLLELNCLVVKHLLGLLSCVCLLLIGVSHLTLLLLLSPDCLLKTHLFSL